MPIAIPGQYLSVPCDVCRLVDGDLAHKQCGYCSLCDAFICEHCVNNWPRRLKAAAKRALEPNYKGMPDYVKLAQGDSPSQS